jgi:hypothetical protein
MTSLVQQQSEKKSAGGDAVVANVKANSQQEFSTDLLRVYYGEIPEIIHQFIII